MKQIGNDKMANITLEQKRLDNIRKQLYGGGQAPTNKSEPLENANYLRADILKIALFTSLAVGIQLFIYFSHLSEKLLNGF